MTDDKKIYERPELEREDYPHLTATEFNQLRYYGIIKSGNVPEKPKGRCPECTENNFILRNTNKYGDRYQGRCLKCGFTINTSYYKKKGMKEGVKWALENPEEAEKRLEEND